MKAAGINTASGKPNKEKVATLTAAQVDEIAKTKMPDLNAASLEAACSMVRGTCPVSYTHLPGAVALNAAPLRELWFCFVYS